MRAETTRRQVLGGCATLGGVAIAGCLASGTAATASVLSAGSLAVVFDDVVGPAFETETEYTYRGEFHGSNTVLRMVSDETKRPDVIVSADPRLLRTRLPEAIAAWDVVFATNALVITYNPETDVGTRLDAGDPWYEVLREASATVARSDPDLDPLGYRTVQLFELAEDHYTAEGLATELSSNLVVDPHEAHLLAGVETGERGAAVTYENMAVDHDLPYVSLPPELDFSDPTYADHYAMATYTTDDGMTVEGTPVSYAVTVPRSAANPEAGAAFVSFLLSHLDLLSANGLVVPDSLPETRGPVPPEVRS